MASIKSATCFGHNGQPISEYASRREALEAAEYANTTYRKKLVPYECDRCGQWHLSPIERQTPSSIRCKCLDRYGMPKALYDTKDGATKRARILSKEKGLGLTVYQCPHSQGFHLSGKK
jgi:hypothetical protein